MAAYETVYPAVSIDLIELRQPKRKAEIDLPSVLVGRNMEQQEAKFWLEPRIELARNYGLNQRQLHEVRTLIEAHSNEFCSAWTRHFGR